MPAVVVFSRNGSVTEHMPTVSPALPRYEQVPLLVLASPPVLQVLKEGGAAVQVAPLLQFVRFEQRVALLELRGTVRTSIGDVSAGVGRWRDLYRGDSQRCHHPSLAIRAVQSSGTHSRHGAVAGPGGARSATVRHKDRPATMPGGPWCAGQVRRESL